MNNYQKQVLKNQRQIIKLLSKLVDSELAESKDRNEYDERVSKNLQNFPPKNLHLKKASIENERALEKARMEVSRSIQ